MIVDASAVLAIVMAEEDADRFSKAISDSPECWISSVNWFEAAIRVDRLGVPALVTEFESVISSGSIVVRPVSVAQAEIARQAHATFGKGRHPAKLNLGDFFAYALARESGRPLLFKGGDFALTDIESAIRPV